MTRFGQLLRQYRQVAGFSQEDLADRARLSVETIGALERGVRRAPYRDTVAVLAAALQLSDDKSREFEAAAAPNRARRSHVIEEERRPNNLPPTSSQLIGREPDLRAITALLSEHRLVSITGPGGVGKTRVALAVAARFAHAAPRPVTLIDLTPIGDGRFVGSNIASSLHLSSEDDASDRIAAALASRDELLLFDNCEHVIDSVALILAEILRRCPRITILATSRERLAIAGECAYRLPSLSFPESDDETSSALQSYTSIQLFLDRVSALDPSLAMSEKALPLLADVCRRLAGIPLAIELAASRATALGLEELRARLTDPSVLAGGSRNLPTRQRTMHATIAWSYDLLNEKEQTLFRRLGIFAGSFRLDAAESICSDANLASSAVVEIMLALVRKSLVNVVRNGERVRYALLESVRSFAREKLQGCDESSAVSRRHLHWAGTIYQVRDQSLTQHEWVAATRPELENVRIALQWAFESGSKEDLVLAGSIVGDLWALWVVTRLRAEYRYWAQRVRDALDVSEHPTIIERLMVGLVLATQGRGALETTELALRHFEHAGKPEKIAWGHTQRAIALFRLGLRAEALAASGRAVNMARDAGRAKLLHYAVALSRHAQFQAMSGDIAGARVSLNESSTILSGSDKENVAFDLTIIRGQIEFLDGNAPLAAAIVEDGVDTELEKPVPDMYLPDALANIACYRLASGDVSGAEEAAGDALDRVRDMEMHTWYEALQHLAASAALRKNPIPAARLMGFVDAYLNGLGHRRDAVDQFGYNLLRDSLGQQLSADELSRHVAAGASLSLEAVTREARTLRTHDG